MLAALAAAPTRIRGALVARDSELMLAGLAALGTGIARDAQDPSAVAITPAPLRGPARIDCGLAGTVMRFLPPVAALADGEVAFTGDERASERPLAPLLAALRDLGVGVAGEGLPLRITGTGAVRGGEVTLDASASSQFVSGLLLSAPRFDAGLDLRHLGPALPSLPHVAMTVAMLRERGVPVEAEAADPTDCRWQVPPHAIDGGDVVIEPDLSNAGPFLAAAMVTGGEVVVRDWPAHTTQAGDALRELFTRMGAEVSMDGGDLRLRGPAGAPRGIDADLSAVGELVPTLAAVAALADGPSTFTGVAHLRGHETDRLRALRVELERLGCGAAELPDGLRITPAPMRGALVECYADHRMATFAAIIGLRVPGVALSDVGTTAKTLPDFAAVWGALVAGDAGHA